MKRLFNLQHFAEGGGAGAASGTGSEGGDAASASVSGASLAAQNDDLSTVMYGKSNVEDNATTSTEDISFDDLIKKGGKYHEDFSKKSQQIIDKRFKQVKELESTLDSHKSILETLATRYGVDVGDIEALQKAVDEDDALYEDAAYQEGLTVKQYREKLQLQRENQRFREAEAMQQQEKHSQEIYAKWLQDADALVVKYGIENFDLATEVQNPQFTSLLASGVDFEGAYKAIHFDEMLGGAMQKTAQNVTQAMANNIASRQSRPSENGLSSQNTQIFKSDPSKFTDADIDEVIKRVRRGEVITL